MIGQVKTASATALAKAIVVVAIAMLSVTSRVQAADGMQNCKDFTGRASFNMHGVSEWLKSKFTEAELQDYGPGDFSVEQCLCNCADEPRPHYPYILIFFRTPKGDLVGRPEPRGVEMAITPLAVRHGAHYCEVGAEDQCFGAFVDPCEFSDFRYGNELAKYFPYCKPDDSDSH